MPPLPWARLLNWMLILPGWKWVPPCIGASLGVYSILQLVDRILRSALVFMLDIKLLQRSHTWLRWSELYDTLMELQIMVCGIQKTQMLALPGIQMQTGLVVWTIERVLQEAASNLVTILSCGWAGNKFRVSLYNWSRVHSRWKLLHTTSLDEEATSWLWNYSRYNVCFLW